MRYFILTSFILLLISRPVLTQETLTNEEKSWIVRTCGIRSIRSP